MNRFRPQARSGGGPILPHFFDDPSVANAEGDVWTWDATNLWWRVKALLTAIAHAMTSAAHTATAWRVFYSNGSGVVTELALGAATTYLQSTGTAAAPIFSVPTLTTGSGNVGSDVALTNANQFYDGPTVSLVAGTWFVVGTVTLKNTGVITLAGATAKLWDGTTAESSGEADIPLANPSYISITLSGIVVPTGTTTYKISVACTVAGVATILAAAGDNGAGNNSSHLRAVKIG